MIGTFVLTDSDDICFIRREQDEFPVISSFFYIPGDRIMSVVLEDGTEEMVTTQIDERFAPALKKAKSILVADLDEEGDVVKEYKVPLSLV